MADVEFSHNMGAYGRDADRQLPDTTTGTSLTTWTNFAGAVVSLALIAGVGVWGYKLLVSDVSGVPVVRAAEGEMRVRPEEPGGQLARHQGLAVNEIAAQGAASGPVDQVTLAPPAVALSVDDQPVATEKPAPIEHPEPLSPAGTSEASAPATITEARVEDLDSLQQGAIDAVVAELTRGTTTLSELDGPKTVAARTVNDATPQPTVMTSDVVLDAPGPRTSMRPKLRPREVSPLLQQAAYTPAPETADVDPAAIPSGTRLAQLGAYESPEVARAEWNKLESRFGDVLQGKSRVIQEAQSGGRTFFRLRAMGFVDLNDTRRFCSAFKAEEVDCIPVQVR